MRVSVILLAALFLAGCGADGEPIQPSAETDVYVSTNGVHLGTSIRLGKGPFAINLGFGL